MANRQLPEGKRIHVYRSGDTHYTGASMVVNPMQVKTLDNLLTNVTSKVEPMWGAVRSIHTPNQGTVIKNLEDLNKKGVYVAAGPKGFVSIPGGTAAILPRAQNHSISEHQSQRQLVFAVVTTSIHRAPGKPLQPRLSVLPTLTRAQNTPKTSSRFNFLFGGQEVPLLYENIGKPYPKNKLHENQKTIRKVGVRNESYSISLYKNGLEDAPVVFRYSSKDFGNWDQVLYRMSEKVRLPQGPIKRLYHTNGKVVKRPEEMVTNGSYVAAASNEQFRKVNYGEEHPQSDTRFSAPTRGTRKFSHPSKGPKATADSTASDKHGRSYSKGPARRKGTRKKGGNGEGEGEGEEEDEEDGNTDGGDKEKRRGGLRRSDHPRGRSKSQPRGTSPSRRHRQKGGTSSASPSRRSSVPGEASGASGEEESAGPAGPAGPAGAAALAAATLSATSRRSKSSYDIPLQIPENDDPTQVDYFKLQSNRPTPATSPETTPTPSRPTSAEGYRGDQGQYSGSGVYPIAEEVEDDPLGASGNHLTSSRYSTVDSGRGSLFSDEERPDSVFRAKAKVIKSQGQTGRGDRLRHRRRWDSPREDPRRVLLRGAEGDPGLDRHQDRDAGRPVRGFGGAGRNLCKLKPGSAAALVMSRPLERWKGLSLLLGERLPSSPFSL
ncbi:doublecortin domain-containing protein 2-like [Penaeus japonicus]|uniref:doublecortin domain-containing protein 2-like n=1 Tax=Penaeus japonicus TaxID=27405 RepID=UPI001C70F90B|nr:doublecortin domain-containing protein 2-like [Penaeus japonicus]